MADNASLSFWANNQVAIEKMIDEIMETEYRLPNFVNINDNSEDADTSEDGSNGS